MQSNVIAFAARKPHQQQPQRRRQSVGRDNVISLASWIDRAIPHRTPHGVYFTTRVLMTTGEVA